MHVGVLRRAWRGNGAGGSLESGAGKPTRTHLRLRFQSKLTRTTSYWTILRLRYAHPNGDAKVRLGSGLAEMAVYFLCHKNSNLEQ